MRAVATALELGYRHIDTADAYGNHVEVGRAIYDSGLERDELFVTTKLWRSDLRQQSVAKALYRSLAELELDYVDLYLIHWPNRKVPIAETLEAMYKLQEKGLVKAIGVSNFTVAHLKDALKVGVPIVCNQVEFHPTLNQVELRDFCQSNGIKLTAYSPIAQGHDLRLPEVQLLAEEYDRSPAQVVLNWLLSKGMVAIPRASDPQHIADNLHTLDWQLTPADVKKLDGLDKGFRVVNPGFAEFAQP